MTPNFDAFLHKVAVAVEKEYLKQVKENFRSRSFFGVPWKHKSKYPGGGDVTLRKGGQLQDSIISHVSGGNITFSSDVPYAAIHNQGGQITVTPKMKGWFWYQYRLAMAAVGLKKDGTASRSKRNIVLTEEAMYWKRMALMKVGSKITIPKRQFLGHHPQIDTIVEQIVDDNVQKLAADIADQLRRAGKP